MKNYLIYIVILAFFLLLTTGVEAVFDGQTDILEARYEKDSVIVKYRQGFSPSELRSFIAEEEKESSGVYETLRKIQHNLANKLTGEESFSDRLNRLTNVAEEAGIINLDSPEMISNNTFVYKTNGRQTIPEIVSVYQDQKEVEYAEPNYLYELMNTPNDPNFSKMWGMAKIQASDSWDQTTGSKTVLVADIDSGVDESHPDLKDNIVEVKSYVGCGGGDQIGHGTHTAGTIGAIGNNSLGVVGVNWKVGLLILKVGCSGSDITLSSLTSAINYAVSKEAKVINMSLGGSSSSRSMSDAIVNAVQKGTVVVVAAGNCGTTPSKSGCGNPPRTISSDLLYPASDPNVITVAATTSSDQLATFSSTGSSVDIAAPGQGILSTYPPSSYQSLSGTSMATPHVTGLVALMFSKDPTLTPQRVKEILESTAQDLGSSGKDQQFGAGRINAKAAIDAISGGSLPTPTTFQPSPTTVVPSPTAVVPTPTSGSCTDRGDYNRDGTINMSDFESWRQDFTQGKEKLSSFECWRQAFLNSKLSFGS